MVKRSTSRRRLSSSLSSCAPRGVIGILSAISGLHSGVMVFLQRAHVERLTAQREQGGGGRARRAQGREVREPTLQRCPANRKRVLTLGLLADGVDDDGD